MKKALLLPILFLVIPALQPDRAATKTGGSAGSTTSQSPSKPGEQPGKQPPAGETATDASKSSVEAGIEWQPFADPPFLRAQTLNRPILLVVTVRWSRPAVRFLTETLARLDVLRVLRERYVPILVDADLRPDLRERYPGVSWPSITLLNPFGDPLYFQTERGKGKPRRMTLEGIKPEKLAAFLKESADYYRSVGIRGNALFGAALANEMKEEREKKVGPVDEASLESVTALLRGNVDEVHGGFGRAPKYLLPTAVEASLMFNRRKRDPPLLEAAQKTLEAAGTLVDPVEGGIHRLASGEDWSGVQYEKLLDRNAEALECFLDAYRATVKPVYLEQAVRIAGYIQKTLSLPDGGFAYAQVADMRSEDGGAYYRAPAEKRARLEPPAVLRKAIAAPTALAVRALLHYAAITAESAPRERALKGLVFLDSKLYTKGRGVQHAWDGEQIPGPLLLEDQIALIAAHLEAYEQTGRKDDLDVALELARFVRDNMRDPASGLLADRIPQRGGPTLLQTPLHRYEENCLAARLFARLHYLRRDEGSESRTSSSPDEPIITVQTASRPKWAAVAKQILEALAPRFPTLGPRAADYGLAAAEYLDGPLWAFLVGNPTQTEARALLDTVFRLDVPFLMRVTLDPTIDAEVIQKIGLVGHDPPALYLSQYGNIAPAAATPDGIGASYKALMEIPTRPAAEQAPSQPPGGTAAGSRPAPVSP